MKLEISRPHGLALQVLKQRLGDRLAHYVKRYPALDIPKYYTWKSEYVVEGAYRGGSGTLKLLPDKLSLELHLPFFARIYQSRIEDFIGRELQAIINATAP